MVNLGAEHENLDQKAYLILKKMIIDRKLLPGTQWEFLKWRQVDAVGFLLSLAGLFGVVGLLWLVLHLGAW